LCAALVLEDICAAPLCLPIFTWRTSVSSRQAVFLLLVSGNLIRLEAVLEPQSTRPHMQKRGRSLRTAVAACARAVRVITEHLADRRKSPVGWSTEGTYLPGSEAGVPEERSAALIYAGAPV
jgi:hypothetical protein